MGGLEIEKKREKVKKRGKSLLAQINY